MQHLCLLDWSLPRLELPLGGFFEGELAQALDLPGGDSVLYVGVT